MMPGIRPSTDYSLLFQTIPDDSRRFQTIRLPFSPNRTVFPRPKRAGITGLAIADTSTSLARAEYAKGFRRLAESHMSEPTDDFEYERRFFCRELPAEYDDGDAPTLIIQSYYVHADNYALRVRLVSRKVHVDMTPDVNPVAVLDEYRDRFSEAYVTVKGPSVGGTRYEVEREIDTRIAAELIKRGGSVIIKNRYSVWIEEDGWSVDVFGGPNAPLIVAEAERSGPVTNLTIPKFCITEITDQARFNNDGLANRPFCKWADDFEEELALEGPRFQQYFGKNRMV